MGDRGNIVIEADGDAFPHPVWLYTHWMGSEVPKIVKAALTKGRERWDDGPYLARVLFQQLIGKDDGVTGFGLSTVEGDGGTEVYVNIAKQIVRYRGTTKSFTEYCK